MSNRAAGNLNAGKRILLAAAALATLGISVSTGIFSVIDVLAQSKAASASFDVASIKANPRIEGNNVFSMTSNPAGITYRQVSLSECIQAAYGVQDVQVVGPSWITLDRYDILARTSNASDAELKEMLQSLLAERFKLMFHRDMKDMNVHTLSVGKGELKLKPSADEGVNSSKNVGFGILLMEHTSMTDFATFMSRRRFFDGPITDATGLKGQYDFTLTLIDPDVLRPNPRAELSTGDDAFFAAIAKLGLRVDVKKMPTEVLVVDRAEKPTLNY